MNDETAIAINYCTSSYRRCDIILALGSEEYLTPTHLASMMNTNISYVSALLKGLKENKIVTCINDNARRNRLYKLTDFGWEILLYLQHNG